MNMEEKEILILLWRKMKDGDSISEKQPFTLDIFETSAVFKLIEEAFE